MSHSRHDTHTWTHTHRRTVKGTRRLSEDMNTLSDACGRSHVELPSNKVTCTREGLTACRRRVAANKTTKNKRHGHRFHTNCSRPKHCRLACRFSFTAKPTEPLECSTGERELPACLPACLPGCACVRVCVHNREVRALSVEFHVEAAVRLRRSRGGEQRRRKTTSPLFSPLPLNFSPSSFPPTPPPLLLNSGTSYAQPWLPHSSLLERGSVCSLVFSTERDV